MDVLWHTYHMPTKSKLKPESLADVQLWLQQQSADLWPAALGSLSFRRSPCIRPNCPACLSGEKHPSYVLYGRQQGRRFSLYVPEELVPQVQRWLDNGRALQELLYQAASRSPSFETREDQASQKRAERCPGLPSRRLPRRLGVAAAGHFAGAAATSISDFLDDHGMIEVVRRDLERGLKIPVRVAD
jgi:hypothetical protein